LKRFNKMLSIVILVLFAGCAYFNTFFNAQVLYKKAFKAQQNNKSKNISSAAKKDYDAVIKKCWKLIDVYGDSSEYADDALLLIGKSYYNIEDLPKAQRVLEQFVIKYNESALLADAKLWLARTFISQENEDEALKILNHIFESKVKTGVAAEAFYILGDLHFNNEDYESAIENLNKCVEIVSDEEIFANVQFMLGDAYSKMGSYENAIQHYQKLKGLDIAQLQEYQASERTVDALIALKKYEEAEINLKKMLRYQRFKPQFSLIETKLGERYTEEGDIEFARNHFEEIFKKYPKSEGGALSCYHLGRLYEFEFVQFDSAQKYYSLVKVLKSYPEVSKDAKYKNTLFKDYLKIRDQLRKDKMNLYSLARGDSSLIDSVSVDTDSLAAAMLDSIKRAEELSSENYFKTEAEKEQEREREEQQKREDEENSLTDNEESKLEEQKKKIKSKKKVVSRTADQVQNSYKKNSFAKGEFFLLKYENADSAEAAYKKFIHEFDDSLLTPKAGYSLYYIYSNMKPDISKADSLKKIILADYSDSPYAAKISGKEYQKEELKEDEEDKEDKELSNPLYIQAEEYRDNKNFKKAIEIFQRIADSDSGSTIAKKSRYYSAFIYEKDLTDIPMAVKEYAKLAKEYPGTPYAKIAKNKIKEPPPEKEETAEEEAVSEMIEEKPGDQIKDKSGEEIPFEEKREPVKNLKTREKEGIEIERPKKENDKKE